MQECVTLGVEFLSSLQGQQNSMVVSWGCILVLDLI